MINHTHERKGVKPGAERSPPDHGKEAVAGCLPAPLGKSSFAAFPSHLHRYK